MSRIKLSTKDIDRIDRVVKRYQHADSQELVKRCELQVEALMSTSEDLARHLHSTKSRIKDSKHLRDKLIRKALSCKAKGEQFVITPENLFEHITDLVGYRILHLHTKQIKVINEIVLGLLKSERWFLMEGPIARTWDDEFREYFDGIGIETVKNEDMYTSVHYVFKANEQAKCACELQVRTLAEELWGEVDHKINYPHKAQSVACREQIKVLARVTSSCSRLVDSIFYSHEEDKKTPRR